MKLSGTRAFVAIVQNVKVGLSPAFGSPTTPTIQSSQDSPAYVCLSVSVCVSIYIYICVCGIVDRNGTRMRAKWLCRQHC